MRSLVSMSQSLLLDASTRELFNFSADGLMEVASLRLWYALQQEMLSLGALTGKSKDTIAIAALCGKGDNAGDALAMLRHAKMDGFQRLSAFIPDPATMKENARLNLSRAERCGIDIIRYDLAPDELEKKLAAQDILLDAVLGTGVKGAAKEPAAALISALASAKKAAVSEKSHFPYLFSIDVPSGLSDEWEPGFPCVQADATLCIEPMKEALFMHAARPYAGKIIPVGGIFPLWPNEAHSRVWEIESADLPEFLPPISPWAHKIQRGRVAIFAGSAAGAGAAMHCVRGAAASGAGYIALYCDEELYSAYLSALGDYAIVRVYSDDTFSAEEWDALVIGPGWGIGEKREGQLARLLQSKTPIILDADGVRLFAHLAEQHSRNGTLRFFKAPLVLTPHPGEFSALQKFISQEEAAQFQSSGMVNQVCSLAQKFGIVVALRASTTHIAFPDESCAICDGSTPGLGVAGSGDVLSGLAGGFLARWRAARELRAASELDEGDHGMWKDPLSAAIISAVLVHAAAGRSLFDAQGWFNPEELARTCARISSWQLDCLKAQ